MLVSLPVCDWISVALGPKLSFCCWSLLANSANFHAADCRVGVRVARSVELLPNWRTTSNRQPDNPTTLCHKKFVIFGLVRRVDKCLPQGNMQNGFSRAAKNKIKETNHIKKIRVRTLAWNKLEAIERSQCSCSCVGASRWVGVAYIFEYFGVLF